MIRVTFAYPNDEGSNFDWDYFAGAHREIVHRELDSRGMVSFEQDKGLSATDPNAPPPWVAIAHMTFNTVEEVHQAFVEAGGPVLGDRRNYTDVRPTIQISEISS